MGSADIELRSAKDERHPPVRSCLKAPTAPAAGARDASDAAISEAEADPDDAVMLPPAALVIRVTIFALHVDVAADPLLDAAADADAVQFVREPEAAAGGAAVISLAEVEVGVSRFGVDQGRGRDGGADAAAEIDVA